jgi:hypothetical protein
VYVWRDWGLLADALKRWDDGDGRALTVVLEVQVPEAWLEDSSDSDEPCETLVRRLVPPDMIRVLVPDVRNWHGGYPQPQEDGRGAPRPA